MDGRLENPSEEIKRLQRCVNDLVSILALPAIWAGGEPSQVVSTLLDALLGMLRLDLVYVRLDDPSGGAPFEMVRSGQPQSLSFSPQAIGKLVNEGLGDDPNQWPQLVRNCIGDQEISILPLRMGLQGETGVFVAGSGRADFPQQTERLVLNVAANQAAIGLHEARLLSQQKRVATELDRRVAERTRELAATNEELQLQVGLLQHLPVAAWTLKPDGTPDFVNQVWLEYSGQTLEFVRSHPEAWMTAVHPEDREIASTSFWNGVRSGQGFAMETRSLRARDGTYRWQLNQAVVLRDGEGKVLKFVGTTTDIEDVKQSQENLRRAEERTRSIIDTALDAVITMDAHGIITSWNKQAEIVFGWSKIEAIGRRMAEMIIPERERAAHERGVRHFLATGDGPILGRRIEFMAVRRSGVEFPVELEVVSLKLGEDWVFSAFVRDITDSKRAEEALRTSERNLTQIINTIPAMAWSTRADGFCDFTNQNWLDFTGLSVEQGRGWGWGAAIHPDDLNGLVSYWQSCLATGTAVDTEARMRRSDGVYRWFLFRANPLRDESGKIVKWYGINTDIEDRKRADDELRRSEAFLAEGQRLNLTGSFTWHLDDDEVTFSDEAYRIFEFEHDSSVTPERIGTRIHPDDIPLLNEKVDSARSSGGDQDYEIRLRMPDGSVKYLHTVSHATRDPDGRLEYVGVVQDVTERRRSEEALSKLTSEIAYMTRVTSLGTLTASIAHEVNQPLSGIVTNASTCLRMLAAEPPNVEGARETARRTIRDGNRASEVIARLRALFSKKDATTEAVDLNEATREVLALSASELQRNQVILQAELAGDLPPVIADRVQIQQVILNLLRNASDAMSGVDDRSRQLVIRTEKEEGDYVRLSVQDTGVGIDPHNLDRLFDAFYTTKEDGMGMGLSVTRSIIERHQGRVWATINDGPGATISFIIPRGPEGCVRHP
jgi:PAS domain S-box-containing protein